MTEGIFNPFGGPKIPKKDFLASTADTPLDTEYQEPSVGDLRLDGGAYVIVLKETELEDMQTRLGALILAAQETHQEALLAHGIRVLPLDGTYQSDEEETILKTPSGYLFVYVGDIPKEAVEDEAFKRLGYLLHQINDRKLLETHNAKVIPRR